MTPEEQGKALAEAVLKQRQEEINKLAEYMKSKGKHEWEYVIADNWQEVLEGFDKGINIPYSCRAVHKLTLNTLISNEE